MINKIDKIWWFKLNGLMRQCHVVGPFAGVCENLVVTEYPKCGGTWLSQMLAEAVGIPYPRSRLPMMRESILHGCFMNIHAKNRKVILLRDGRDALVSYYYHMFTFNSLKSSQNVSRMRNHFEFTDIENIRANLPSFIDECFTKNFYPRFTWSEFINRWIDDAGVLTTYEALHADAESELERIIRLLNYRSVTSEDIERAVDKYRFENVSNRMRGDSVNSSHVRKGIVGDWKNHFSLESRKRFNVHGGLELIRSGYESSSDWVFDV